MGSELVADTVLVADSKKKLERFVKEFGSICLEKEIKGECRYERSYAICQ